MKTIEITIPILNEESSLEQQVEKVLQFLQAKVTHMGDISLVLADNGSTDNTPEIANRLARAYPAINYLRLNKRGVGLALKASWGQSKADIVGYMDLDLATDLNYLEPALLKLLNDEADIVTGTRLATGSKVVGRSTLRNITSYSFNKIVKFVFNNKFSDGMCGFKFLNRGIFDDLCTAGAQSDGWFFATEVLVTGEWLGYRVFDLPVTWTDDPNSKVKLFKLTMEYLKAMSSLKKKLKDEKSQLSR